MTQGVGCWRCAPRLMLGVNLTKILLDNFHFHTPARTIKNIPLKSYCTQSRFCSRLERISMSIHPVADDPIGLLRLVPEKAVTAAVDDFHLGAFDVVA